MDKGYGFLKVRDMTILKMRSKLINNQPTNLRDTGVIYAIPKSGKYYRPRYPHR